MKNWLVGALVLLGVLMAMGRSQEPDTATASDLAQDAAWHMVKIIQCTREGDETAAAKHRRYWRAFQDELFERFTEAEATEAMQRWMTYYRHSPPRGC